MCSHFSLKATRGEFEGSERALAAPIIHMHGADTIGIRGCGGLLTPQGLLGQAGPEWWLRPPFTWPAPLLSGYALAKVTLLGSSEGNDSPELAAPWQVLHNVKCVEHIRCSAIVSYFIVIL